jgi:glycosyltransferase involved in cell wall biosynthesis
MNNGDLQISLLVPVWNGMPHLPKTIESLILNAPRNSEIIIRNNGSTDGTAEYLSSLSDSRIRVFSTGKSESAAQNWTAICRLARGRFVKIVCADDLIHEGAIDRQLAALEQYPNGVMVASRRNIIDESGKVILRGFGLGRLKGAINGNDAIRKSALSGNNIFGEPVSVLFRAEALKNSLPFESEWAYLTDLEMYRKVLRHGDLIALRSIDSSFRLTTKSWSQSLIASQKSEFLRWAEGVRDLEDYDFGFLHIFRIRMAVTLKTWLRQRLNRITHLKFTFPKLGRT